MSVPQAHLRSKTPTGRRHLLVVRAGNNSLHRNWLVGKGARTFDLLVSYYGDDLDRFANDAEHFHRMKGTRWAGHDAIMRGNPALMAGYDRVCFACDDLDADLATWNALFAFCEDYGLDLAQPAILGPISYPITAPVAGLLYRETTFVEVMCPVFSGRALAFCKATFGESVSGWGLDFVWCRLLADHGWRLGIIDSLCVTHTRPLGEGGLYTLLGHIAVDPRRELDTLVGRYGSGTGEVEEVRRTYRSIWSGLIHAPPRQAKRWAQVLIIEPARRVARILRRWGRPASAAEESR
jgi:hypothetical protein